LRLLGEAVHRLLQVAPELVLAIFDVADGRDRLLRLITAEDVADAPERKGGDQEREQDLDDQGGGSLADRSQHGRSGPSHEGAGQTARKAARIIGMRPCDRNRGNVL